MSTSCNGRPGPGSPDCPPVPMRMRILVARAVRIAAILLVACQFAEPGPIASGLVKTGVLANLDWSVRQDKPGRSSEWKKLTI